MKTVINILALAALCSAASIDESFEKVQPRGSSGRQFFRREGSDEYTYGYTNAEGFKTERRTSDGVVTGVYGYTDPRGFVMRVEYIADNHGFRILSKKRLQQAGEDPVLPPSGNLVEPPQPKIPTPSTQTPVKIIKVRVKPTVKLSTTSVPIQTTTLASAIPTTTTTLLDMQTVLSASQLPLRTTLGPTTTTTTTTTTTITTTTTTTTNYPTLPTTTPLISSVTFTSSSTTEIPTTKTPETRAEITTSHPKVDESVLTTTSGNADTTPETTPDNNEKVDDDSADNIYVPDPFEVDIRGIR